MSHMIYEDYRKSALKHLKTCEFMLENLDKIPAVDNLDGLSKEEWKNHVLRNIFYLTGYAAEGIINYCIYKLAYGIRGNNLDIERLNIINTWPSTRPHRSSGICFRLPIPVPTTIFYDYIINNHNYAANKDYIVRKVGIAAFTAFPSKANCNTDKNAELFYNWAVKIRYQSDTSHFNPFNPSLTFTEDDILNFFIFVKEKLYSTLPTIC